jgi:cytochrome P450
VLGSVPNAASVNFDPFTAEAIEDPYPQYDRLRAADPVHWSEKLRSWVLFRYDDVCAFFRDDRRLSSDRSKAAKFKGPAMQGGVALRTVASDPPEHTPVRAMLTASLTPRVRTIGPRVDDLIAALLERVAEVAARAAGQVDLVGEVDLVAEFAYPLPIRVIAELLAVPVHERQQLQRWSQAIAAGMDRFYSGGEASQGLAELGAYLFGLLPERRAAAGEDLVHRLLAAEYRGDRLTDLEVVAMCTALVFGGHETTVNLITNGMLALLRNPEALRQLRAQPALVETAVEELLRYDSPAQLISRTAVADFDLRGKRVRAGEAVVAAIGAANHDPAVFEAADCLCLTRAPNPHLAFGLGTHFCPGAQLSRIEARAAIAALTRRFPTMRLGSSPPVRRKTAVLRGLERLPVHVVASDRG